jgi:hypothetical protein
VPTVDLTDYPAVGDTLTCGHVRPAMPTPGGTGVATTRDGRTFCYPCADASEREAFETADTFTAYVSMDGRRLTTWPGGTLAHTVIGRHGVSRSGWHGSEVHSWRFFTGIGAARTEWYGRNAGPGMVITVRRAKH